MCMSVPTILYHTLNSWIAQLDPQILAQSMDSCEKYGSMDRADPHIAPNSYKGKLGPLGWATDFMDAETCEFSQDPSLSVGH